MQLWNLMYKNKEIANLLTNGIEGVHYEYTDESRSSVRSLEGSTWDSMDWPWPNSSLAAVYEGLIRISGHRTLNSAIVQV